MENIKTKFISQEQPTQVAQLPESRQNCSPERLFSCFETEFHEEILQQSVELVNNDYIPLIVSNHQSHADGLALAQVVEKIKNLTKKVEGFYLPYATSMTSGHQGETIKTLFNQFTMLFTYKGLHLIPVTREKDIKNYGIKDKNLDSLRKIWTARRNHFGIAFLPEGTVEGGRLKENSPGEIRGMVEAEENNALNKLIQGYNQAGVNYFVLPVAINGSHKVFSPDTYKVDINNQVSVKVGGIITNKELKNVSNCTNMILERVGALLPKIPAGHYCTP